MCRPTSNSRVTGFPITALVTSAVTLVTVLFNLLSMDSMVYSAVDLRGSETEKSPSQCTRSKHTHTLKRPKKSVVQETRLITDVLWGEQQCLGTESSWGAKQHTAMCCSLTHTQTPLHSQKSHPYLLVVSFKLAHTHPSAFSLSPFSQRMRKQRRYKSLNVKTPTWCHCSEAFVMEKMEMTTASESLWTHPLSV